MSLLKLPKIAVSMGDPAGIGPEIIVSAHAGAELFSLCRPVVYGDPAILRRAMGVTGVSLEVALEGEPGPGRIVVAAPSALRPQEIPFGRPSLAGDKAMVGYILAAAQDVMSGEAAALVTCPITKEGLKAAGVAFPGHTEFLVHLCGGADVVMMLAGDRLRVALVTIHISLKDALELLSTALIEKTIRVTFAFFRKHMGISAPRIAVAAVNPHAGEGGMFGDEESRLIAPAISACAADGIDVSGPHSPDTVFHRAYNGEFDVVVAMTHDHGLIPLKMVHFGEAVNVTMGLPIVRTSVDHGTAYDIAGKGTASPASLMAAVRMAARMAGCAAGERPKAK